MHFPNLRSEPKPDVAGPGRTDLFPGTQSQYTQQSAQQVHSYDPVTGGMLGAQSGAMEMPGAVLMVYGVDNSKLNCDRMCVLVLFCLFTSSHSFRFNLFCLYGNVIRVKFLKTKDDTCMVEMSSAEEAKRAVDYLQGATVLGKELTLR